MNWAKNVIKIAVIFIFLFFLFYIFDSKLVTTSFAKGNIEEISQKKAGLVYRKSNDKPKFIENKKIKTNEGISAKDLNRKRYLTETPNDTYYQSDQVNHSASGQMDSWNLRNIGLTPTSDPADSAWKITTGSSSTVVAVIDTGIDLGHVDLVSNLWVNTGETPSNGIDDDNNGEIDDVNGFNFADSYDANNDNDFKDVGDTNNANVTDLNSHGTHVSGIIAGSGNNTKGISGVCWTCKIMTLKVINSYGFAYDSDIALAIYYAIDEGAKVINMSLGGGGYSESINDAVKYAFTQGVLVVSSSGNDYANASDSYPGASEGGINVGAINSSNVTPSFSNTGSRMDIVAPGVYVLSTKANINGLSNNCITSADPNDAPRAIVDYFCMSGTSMSAPHVSGVAALVYDYLNSVPETQAYAQAKYVRNILLKSTTDLNTAGFDTTSGYGKVNGLGAINYSPAISDAVLPTVSLNAIPNNRLKGTYSITGSVNDSNLYIYTISFKRTSDDYTVLQRSGRANVSNSELLSINTTLVSDGNYTINLYAEDFFGNTANTTLTNITVDNTPPSALTITSPNSSYINQQQPNFSWTTSTDVSGAVVYDLILNGNTIITDNATTSYSYTGSFADGSSNSFYVTAKDIFGNTINSNSINFVVDITNPTVTNSSITSDLTGFHYNANVTDNISGINKLQWSFDGGSFTDITLPYTNDTLTDGMHTFTFRSIDNAGNILDIPGSYTYTSRTRYLLARGDFNKDSKTDLSDLSILAANWLKNTTNGDANGDGKVDLSDLSILASNWQNSY